MEAGNRSATINVPSDQPTIQASINAAVSGVDEVLIADGDVAGNDFLTFSNCFNGSLNPPPCP